MRYNQRRLGFSTIAVIAQYTTTAALQFYQKESSRVHHIYLSESLQNI